MFSRILKVLLVLVLCQARADDLAKYIRTEPGSETRHATGFVRDDPARYQATAPVPRFRAFYPAQWDLSADLPPPVTPVLFAMVSLTNSATPLL